jgi:voltage-gated potassium channel
MSKATMQRLGRLELFEGCRRSQLEKIDELGGTLVVPSDQTLCVEGTPGAEFFVLVDGLVDVRTSTGTHALLRPGAWFGEAALIDKAPRRATVVTRTASMLIVFGRSEFNTLLEIAPQVRTLLQRSASLVIHSAIPARRRRYQPVPSGFPRGVARCEL